MKAIKYVTCPHCKELNAVSDANPYFECTECGKKCNNPEFVPLDLGCDLE